MESEKEISKPLYKKLIGILIVVCFWPLFLIYVLASKRNLNLSKMMLTLGSMLVIFGLAISFKKTKVVYPIKEVGQSESITTTPRLTTIGNNENDTYEVTRVIDGDTIEIEGGIVVRYIGVNSPEIDDSRDVLQCFGNESYQENKKMVEGKKITLVKDISDMDKYGRWLRYVYVDGVFVNDYLVRYGYANARSYPPDVKFQSSLRKSEEIAEAEGLGLWSHCQIDKIVLNTPIVIPSTVPTQTNSKCELKGNINSDGDKIFHTPGCNSYIRTVIDTEIGEKWFCSEEEAIAAGWRKAKNCN